MSKEYVAKESTSQSILTGVNSLVSGINMSGIVVLIADFKNDPKVVTKGGIDELNRQLKA